MHHSFWKRVSATLAAVLLSNALLLNAAVAGQTLPVTEAGIFESAYDAQAVQDTLYVLMEDKLVSIVQGQEAPAPILYFSEYPEFNWYSALLFSDGVSLFALDTMAGIVYQVEGSTLNQTARIDLSDIAQAAEDGSPNGILQYPVIRNGYLYALYISFADYSSKLCRFSLEGGKAAVVPTNGYSFQEMTAYRDGQLLGLDSNTRKIVAVDAATGKMTDEIGSPAGYSVGAVAYDAADDRVYSLCDAEVLRWEGKRPVTVGYLSADSASGALYAGIWNGQYTLVDNTGLYACHTALGEGGVRPLVIWSAVQGLLDSKLTAGFMRLYPQTPVVVRGAESDNPLERVSTVNITGDAGVDIFAVSSHDMDGGEVFRRGYAAGLDSAILKDDVLSMYPQIQEYLTRNGILFGFPAALWTRYWTVSPELLEEAQLGAIPELIDDYYDMMRLWYEEYGGDQPAVLFDGNQTVQGAWREAIYLLTSQYIYAYASGDQPLTFNTPVFRAALEKVAALAKWKGEDAARDNREEARKSIFQTNAIEPFFQYLNPEASGVRYIAPPAFAKAGQPTLDTTLVYFIVNPHSQNREAAIRFLEFFSQNMELALRYQLHPDDNELVERQDYPLLARGYAERIEGIKARMAALEDEENLFMLREELGREEDAFAQEKKNRWEYPAEGIAEYRGLAPYMDVEHSNLIWRMTDALGVETILMKYLEGHATLDQALSELDRKVAMMFLESQ